MLLRVMMPTGTATGIGGMHISTTVIDHGHAFVFIDGFWWGLDPGFYPFDAYAYGSNPYDYYNGYPSDYNGDYDGDNGYYDDPGYGTSDQYENNETVSAAQS